MYFCGDRIQKLEGETNPLQPRCGRELWQEAVVIPAASTQTMPCPIERHSRNDGKLDVGIIRRNKKRPRRFHDAESSRHERFLALIEMQLQFVPTADRQEYAFAVPVGYLNQRPNIHFVRQRVIQKQGARLLPPGRTEHLAAYLFRHRRQLAGGVLFLLRPNVLTQLLLGHFLAFALSYFSQSLSLAQRSFCASVLAKAAASAAASFSEFAQANLKPGITSQ